MFYIQNYRGSEYKVEDVGPRHKASTVTLRTYPVFKKRFRFASQMYVTAQKYDLKDKLLSKEMSIKSCFIQILLYYLGKCCGIDYF